MAGRREVPVDPGAGPVQRFAFELRKLRAEAGGITYRALAQRAGYSVTTLSQAASGEQLPTLPVALAYVRACGGDTVQWEARWKEAVGEAAVRLAAEGEEDVEPPYRGLARYETGDSARFFGRDRLVDDLLELLRRRRFGAVFGPSGSGKSSLVRAGLIPALRQTRDAALRPAAIRILTPGPHPARTHARVLEPSGSGPGRPDGDTVVIVDQFEEIFTLCQDSAERARFLKLLLNACRRGQRLRVLIAVRADFYGRCAEHRDLAEALHDAQLLVGPMSPAELREAIVKPAAAQGLTVERALTSRLVGEVAEAPGGLPLLSHVLLETWRRRRGKTLTMTGYEVAGGLAGAVAKTAEDVHREFTEAQAATARRVLSRLVTPGSGVPDTHRPTARTELEALGRPEAAQVLEALTRARLLTLDGDTVDLAHEALLTGWPRLRTWIEEDRARLRFQRSLTEAARTWEELGRDQGALYRGTRLATAAAYFGPGPSADLTEVERAFLDAGTTAHEREERLTARTTRRLRALTVTLSVLVVLALTAGLLAWLQSRSSDRQRRDAEAAQRVAVSRQLASQSAALSGTDSDLAALLAVQAYRTDPTAQAAESLYAAATVPLRHRLVGHRGAVLSVAFRSDGRVVSAADDGTVKLWDTAAGRLRRTFPNSAFGATAFTPDGRTLATGGYDGGVEVRDTSTGRTRERLAVRTPDTFAEAVSPDGRTLATSSAFGTELWDLRTGRRRASLPPRTRLTGTNASGPDSGSTRSWAFSPDGRTLATGGSGGGVELWDTRTGHRRGNLPGPASPVDVLIFSPDGRTLATSGDGVELWDADAHEGSPRHGPLAASTVPVSSMAFSPDGRTLATGGDDHTVRLWDTASGRLESSLTGHTGAVLSLAFSPDGRTLATGGDHTVRLWNMPDDLSHILFSRHPRRADATVFAPDGRTVATSRTGDRAVQLWDAATGRLRTSLPWPGKSGVTTVPAFSPDGGLLATSASTRGIELWDTGTGRRRKTMTGFTGKAYALRFSPDGDVLASAGLGRGVELWDTATGRLLAGLTGPAVAMTALAFSSDGRTLATGSAEGSVQLWDTRTGQPGRRLTGHTGTVLALAFSPDGRLLAAGGEDRTTRLWDPVTGRDRGSLPGHTASVRALAFSPDGGTLATGSDDRTARLWDPATGGVRATFSGHTSAVSALAFSPDGRTLTTVDDDSTIRVRNAVLPTPTTAISAICRAVHRDLTPRERSMYLPDGPARPVCPA